MNNVFVNYRPTNTILNFDDLDSEKNYKKNLKKQSNNWIYRFKKIKYRFNEYGFRGESFLNTDWKNSVVVIGDSITFGSGLAEEDTISNQLKKILKINTVNLGIIATAIDLACINSLMLHEHLPKPKAIVQVWTSLGRYTNFSPSKKVQAKPFIASWPNYYFRHNWPERSKYYILSDRALWKNKLPYSEITFFQCTAEKVKIDYIEKIDYARDDFHPGIESCYNAAITIAANLKKQGI
jgi:hypothetical protein